MCGIAGLLRVDGAPPAVERLEAMARALHHRGPDAHGTVCRGAIGFAATRLAIVDPGPGGDQPVHDGTHVLTCNGEVYDHQVARQRLEAAGVDLVGRSDTAVLFHLLAADGVPATLPRLRGMFAFAWTDGDGHVHLVRDRFGIKPLHWTRRGDEVLWASEVKALAAVVPVRPHAGRALAGVLSLADRWASRTVFEDVHQVGPGEHVTIAPDGTVTTRRWHQLVDTLDPALAEELARAATDEVRERLDLVLEAAVARMDGRLDAAPGVVGTLVSGGVDSSLVAALAHPDAAGHRLFTAAVSGPQSELAAAQALADHLGRPLTAAPVAPERFRDDWVRGTWHHEAPVVTHTNALSLACVMATVHAEGTKAVLCGEGADELFAGYTTMAGRSQLDVLRLPYRALRRGYGLVPGLASKVLPREGSDEGFLAALTDDFEQARAGRAAAEATRHLPADEARSTGLALLALQGHLRTLLHRDDRMGMRHAVEARFPFLDEDVVRLAVNLPHRHRVALSRQVHDRKHPFLRDKALLRDLARRRGLPGADRPKSGFPSWGHLHVRIDADLFHDGWVAEQLGLTSAAVAHLVAEEDPYQVAKLASVEVFGRTFGGDALDDVERLVQRTVTPAPHGVQEPSRGRRVPWDRWRSPI